MPAPRLGGRVEQLADALVALARVHPNVELREVEPEQLDAAAQRGKRAVGDAPATIGPQAAVDHVEVLGEARDRRVRVVAEPPPGERELAPVGLVDVLVADRQRVFGQLALVTRDRVRQLRVDRRQPRGDADLCGKRTHLVAVAGEHQLPRPLERLADRARARTGIAVGVAPDPRAEAERRRRARKPQPVLGEQPLGRVDQALLEEPVAVADLVDDARAAGAHLVGLPEHRDLRSEVVVDLRTPQRREQRVVQLLEQRADAQVRGEHRAPRGLGRVRGQHELERDALRRLVAELQERVGERLARHSLLVQVLAPPPHAVMLLRDVRQLEIERERPQHASLLRVRQLLDRRTQLVERRPAPGPARQPPDVLDVREQRLVLLLDEHPPEQVAEQADVPPQRCIRPGLVLAHGHGARVGNACAKPDNGRRSAPPPG